MLCPFSLSQPPFSKLPWIQRNGNCYLVSPAVLENKQSKQLRASQPSWRTSPTTFLCTNTQTLLRTTQALPKPRNRILTTWFCFSTGGRDYMQTFLKCCPYLLLLFVESKLYWLDFSSDDPLFRRFYTKFSIYLLLKYKAKENIPLQIRGGRKGHKYTFSRVLSW